ncbi:MAG: putative sugar O-methyltransferase [Magnetococcales bacterium]|nr:putative sugar O-methyltransferase [Magnetococcales bacterium]
MSKIENLEALQPPFSYMLENFLLARKNRPFKDKSNHWDFFPPDYEKAIITTKAWPAFLRNSLSLGFNDDLIKVSNTRWDKSGDGGISKKIDHDYKQLIGPLISDEKHQKEIIGRAELIIAICGLDFLGKFASSDIGSPATLRARFSSDGVNQKTITINDNDLSILYYFYQINRIFNVVCKRDAPLIVEIGGGFGGLIAKIKQSRPNVRCVMLDLPEITAVQTYYLCHRFPDKKFLFYKDWQQKGSAIFQEEFDFLIAPGWMICEIPDISVDLVINMRSMMEMTNSVIDFYFDNIQRITAINGLFACFNRYYKETSGDAVMLKHYPFDNNWKIVLSQSSITQNIIHDLIVQRQSEKSQFSIKESLRSLPPF